MSLTRMSYNNMPSHVASNANSFTRSVLAANLPLDLALCLSAKGLRLPVTLGLFWRLANETTLAFVHGGARSNRALAP